MSYNSELAENNAALRAILEQAQSLPDKDTGGGGGELDALVSGTLATFEWAGESIRSRAFFNLSSLQIASFPNATHVGEYAFYGCTNLSALFLPKVENVDTNAFSRTAISEIELPSAKKLGTTLFDACIALKKADFGAVVSSVQGATFRGCTVLDTLILRNETLVTLANTSVFASTPFASGGTGGTVYVPSALIDSYKTATNWSTLYAAGTCNFVALEGSAYE